MRSAAEPRHFPGSTRRIRTWHHTISPGSVAGVAPCSCKESHRVGQCHLVQYGRDGRARAWGGADCATVSSANLPKRRCGGGGVGLHRRRRGICWMCRSCTTLREPIEAGVASRGRRTRYVPVVRRSRGGGHAIPNTQFSCTARCGASTHGCQLVHDLTQSAD